MGMKINDTLKTVAIVSVVAVVSFFVAQAVIPEKKSAAKDGGESIPEESLRKSAVVVSGYDYEDIPVVTVDHTPVEVSIGGGGGGIDEKVVEDEQVPGAVEQKSIQVLADSADRSTEPMPALSVQTPIAPKPEVKPDTAVPQKTITPIRQPEIQSNLKVEKSAVCAAIENREPKGISDRFSKDSRQIYYFTHITGAKDTAIIMHRWYHEGKLFQNSILRINSSSWRTHSRRSLINADEMVGKWRVETVEQKTGRVLDEAEFVIEK